MTTQIQHTADEPSTVLTETIPLDWGGARLDQAVARLFSDYSRERLKDWINQPNRLQSEAKNKMSEWLNQGLQDWDISRDAPYFGFKIPNTEDKYFYVWLDAPIGYMASFLNYCTLNNLNFDSIWNSDNTEIHHFLGKDILYFHALFWPSVLHKSGYKNTVKFNNGKEAWNYLTEAKESGLRISNYVSFLERTNYF